MSRRLLVALAIVVVCGDSYATANGVVVGPTGATGPRGATGPTGLVGPQGPGGTSVPPAPPVRRG